MVFGQERRSIEDTIKQEAREHKMYLKAKKEEQKVQVKKLEDEIKDLNKKHDDMRKTVSEAEQKREIEAVGREEENILQIAALDKEFNDELVAIRCKHQEELDIATGNAASKALEQLQQNYDEMEKLKNEQEVKVAAHSKQLSDARKLNDELQQKKNHDISRMTKEMNELKISHAEDLKDLAIVRGQLEDERRESMKNHKNAMTNIELLNRETIGKMDIAENESVNKDFCDKLKSEIGNDISSIVMSSKTINARMSIAMKTDIINIIQSHKPVFQAAISKIKTVSFIAKTKITAFQKEKIDEFDENRKSISKDLLNNIKNVWEYCEEVMVGINSDVNLDVIGASWNKMKNEINDMESKWETMPDIVNPDLVYDIFKESTTKLMSCDFSNLTKKEE